MKQEIFRGIRPDDLGGRMGLKNPERGFRTEVYASTIPGEIAGMCTVHQKRNKLDGRCLAPPCINDMIRGNRLDGVEFRHCQWQDELDYCAYDGLTVIQGYVYLNKFSDGRPLSAAKLEDIEEFFFQIRRRGIKVLLRFAYELSPCIIGPTGATILRHLEQLKPLIRKNIDIIYSLQCGFPGWWGEWHHSFHHLRSDVGFQRDLFAAVLEVLPASRRTMIRYPRIKQAVYGEEPLPEALAFSSDPRARIGHFNDGCLAGPGHAGTFCEPNREAEFDYVTRESRFLPMDGELLWHDRLGAVSGLAAARHFTLHHFDTFGIIHSHSLGQFEEYSIDHWKSVPIDLRDLADAGMPLSADYCFDAQGEPVLRSYYEYIRDHLGYRIELQRVELPDELIPGKPFSAKVYLINRGFSTPVNPRPVHLVLENGAERVEIPIQTEIQRWFGCRFTTGEAIEQELKVEFLLPETLPPGRYRVGLAMPDEAETLAGRPEYAIRCANNLEFRDGVNFFQTRLECISCKK